MSYHYFKKDICLSAISILLVACAPVSSNGEDSDLEQVTSLRKENVLDDVKNGCASWQTIPLNENQYKLLVNLRDEGNFNENTQPKIIYIKTLDNDYIDTVKNNSNNLLINNPKYGIKLKLYNIDENEYEERVIRKTSANNGLITSKFNPYLYEEIKNEINKININNMDGLVNDLHAQKVLKFDLLGIQELYLLLGDDSVSASYDNHTKRQLSVGDLANGLLMIIYGEDYWNDNIFPAPAVYLRSFRYEHDLPLPAWEELTNDEKIQAFTNEEHRKFISRIWGEAVVGVDWHISQPKLGVWRQSSEWIKEILAEYPNENHDYVNALDNTLTIPKLEVRNLKSKLTIALNKAEEIKKNCS